MPISSNIPTSRRHYLSQDELKQYANITILDTDEADDVIGQCEELIDTYVKRTNKFLNRQPDGLATSGTTTTIIDTSSDTYLYKDDNYYKWCEVEIIGGTNEGERRKITSSDKDNYSITVDEAFDSAIDDTSYFVISQIGLFPRYKDVIHENDTYYKRIPENVKRATAAQVEYFIEKGDSFFKGASNIKAESIGDYSVEKGVWGEAELIAPKARNFLKGYTIKTGQMIASNPTRL